MTKLQALSVVFLVAYTATFLRIETFESYAYVYGAFTGRALPDQDAKQSVMFVGDIMLARKVEYLMDRHGSDYPFLRLDPFRTDTFVVANFESAMAANHHQTPFYTFSFSTDPKHLSALRNIGFTHLGLANNHTFDKGPSGYDFASSSLHEAGLAVFGHPRQLDENSVTVLELGSRKVAVIAIHTVTGEPSMESLQKTFLFAKENSDVQVAYVHWGTEYEPVHSQSQERFARKLIHEGADAVVGHHPHVVQDIGLVEGVPVFYSLGNFIFDQYFSQAVQEGLIVELEPNKDSVAFKLRAVTSTDMQSVPRPMTEDESKVFFLALAGRSDKGLGEMIQAKQLAFELPLANGQKITSISPY